MEIRQVDGPIASQFTEIDQEAGDELSFVKDQRRHVPVGAGLRLSICQVYLTAPENADISSWVSDQFGIYRDRALAAAGLLAAVFDERVVQREMFEDLVILDADGRGGDAGIDSRREVRRFRPHLIDGPVLTALDQLEKATIDEIAAVGVASRWYLRAVQDGPTPDAVAALWTAIEGLIGKRSNKAAGLKSALQGVGVSDIARFARCDGHPSWRRHSRWLGAPIEPRYRLSSARGYGPDLAAVCARDRESMAGLPKLVRGDGACAGRGDRAAVARSSTGTVRRRC